MALTRGTRRQLVVFAVITVLAVTTVSLRYLELPKLLGFGQDTVTVNLPNADGLHRSSLVKYRGVEIGRVSSVDLTMTGARATLKIDADSAVPADARVEIHSTSAAGEQYLDLVPTSDRAPYLEDGTIIPSDRVTPLPSSDAFLESVTRLARSAGSTDTNVVLDELMVALGGKAETWRSLIESIATISGDSRANLSAITTLLDQAGPFLGTQLKALPDLTQASKDLNPVTATLAQSTGELQRILADGGPALHEFASLLSDLQPDVAVILRDLTSTGQVVKTYLPGLEQILVLYPAAVAGMQAATGAGGGADPASVHLAFRPNINRPQSCLKGFIPLTQQRDFRDETHRTSIIPDLYCKEAADDPRDVRGARNSPCFNVPGRRAASVEQCLGREIGEVDDPLPPRLRKLGNYSLRTGRAVDADGMTFLLGRTRATSSMTLQELFTG